MNLIALVGHPAAGKTTLARKLADEFGVLSISGSNILLDSLETLPEDQRPLLDSRSAFSAYHMIWRKRHGLSVMGDYVVKAGKRAAPQIVCFENLRNRFDADRIKQYGGVVASLQCSVEERFRRAMLASRPKDPKSIQAFIRVEQAEYNSPSPYGSQVVEIMAESQIKLDASRPIDAIVCELRMLLPAFGIKL